MYPTALCVLQVTPRDTMARLAELGENVTERRMTLARTLAAVKLPKSVDWVKAKKVTPVKEQSG